MFKSDIEMFIAEVKNRKQAQTSRSMSHGRSPP